MPEHSAMTFLELMAAGSLERARQLRIRARRVGLETRAADTPPPPTLRLHPDGFDLIAEIKRRSPSEGPLGVQTPVVARARSYAEAGATAVSVLTEPDEFAGELSDIRSVSGAIDVPVMRKDFLVDPIQITEARAAGAGGVLLIAAILPGDRLIEMADAASAAGLFSLIEAFDAGELERAGQAARRNRSGRARSLVGLNARDLRTLQVDPDRLRDLAPRLPVDVPAVAESGMNDATDVIAVSRAGYRAALVGTALMRADDPGRLIEAMLRAGRNPGAAG